MPGNESDDRVYNFFPQDNLLQGRYQQTLEGNWSVANNNFWVGGQIGLPNTITNNVDIQHSVTDRGQGSHVPQGQSGLDFTQTSSNFAQNLFQRQQLNSNGYMFGNHANQTGHDRSNIFAVDTIPDQHNLVSRGLSMYESHQGPGPQCQTKSLVRPETSEYPVTFNLFGHQQQMHHPQSSMLQSFQKQQSGFSDMQQLQQQIMWRKMQELQRHQQTHLPDVGQQNAVIPISQFSKQSTCGYPSAIANGPRRADSQNSHWGAESGNTHLLQHASSVVQGSPNGFVNSANHGQEHCLINLGVQQGNQSLYGDTYSWSRGNLTQISEITVKKPSMEQMLASVNNVPASQYQTSTEQTNTQAEPTISSPGFPGETPYYNPSDRTVQQMNSMTRIASSKEIHHEVAHSQEKTFSENVASQNEVSLNPTEARILYGSEDNIWAAFGKSLDDCGDAGSPFDHFQSGTWSALMQSAVAETSSSDVGQQEALDGVDLQNTSTHSENQTFTHSRGQETSTQAMLWKNVNSAIMSYGSGSVDRSHHYVSPENQSVDSSLNNRGKENTDTSEMENYKRNDSSNNSYCSDLSRNNSSGCVKENVTLDVGDSHSLPSGKQKYFNHNTISKTSKAPLKFQFYPVENVDEDTLVHHDGAKHSSHSLTSQQSTDFEGFKAFIPEGSVDLEKGRPADKKDANGISDTRGNFHGHIQNATVPFDQHVDMCTPVKHTPPSSQNMLELLHKIDQLRGHGLLMPSSPSDSQLPKTDDCDSSASCLQQNQTSTSQGFGLQLGPPSHRTVLPDHSLISLGSLQKKNTSHQSQDVSDIGERGRSQFPSSPAVQSLPPLCEKSDREFNPNRSVQQVNQAFMHTMPGSYLSTSNSDYSRSRSLFQHQQMVKDSGLLSENQQNMLNHIQKNDSFSRSSTGQTTETLFTNASWNSLPDGSNLLQRTSNQISAPESHLRGLVFPTSTKDVSSSQDMKGYAQQGTPFGQPHLLTSQIRRTSSSNVLRSHQPNVLGSNSFIPHKHGEQESIAGHISPSVSGSSSMNKGSPALQDSTRKVNMAQRDELQRPEPASNNYRDGSSSNSVTMHKDMEAFGRSLVPSNSSHQNYSLLRQMQITKSAETDPNERASKRMNFPGSVEECQQLSSTTAKSSDKAVSQHASVSSGDSKIPSFAELKDNAGSKVYAQLVNVISQNTHASSQEDSRFNHDGNNPSPVKVDHLNISPQMAPSFLNRLNRYGGVRNGRMLTEYDSLRGDASKTAVPPFSHGNTSSSVHMSNSNEQVVAACIGPGQIGKTQQIPIPSSAAVEPQTLVLNVPRAKKRERATFQLKSWCKEASQGSRNPQTISMAEVYWAKAANRLTEKIEDEVKFSEDGLPMLRAKRRIKLTTQLMQQLLSPPKSAILNSVAELYYDGVAYSISRLALGEACGLLPNRNSDSEKSHHVVNLFSGKDNELEKVNDRHLSKLEKGSMGRAQKLESDLLRLDKRSCLIDVRSECQELEKFSIINRFAIFHGRGQVETDLAANALRPYPQRNVTALPVSRNLPDRVHCLSL